ncbi:hypothetical protein OHC33_010727 [Knufia fluminis]|uniref:Uncharacterized protein n=1 Tax=Knufia fluminis TaxID=191047 RepID=A0AAN8ECR7_9EURO|nr:hypothetical protein OHC33_010727 [Knufia fluminis]
MEQQLVIFKQFLAIANRADLQDGKQDLRVEGGPKFLHAAFYLSKDKPLHLSLVIRAIKTTIDKSFEAAGFTLSTDNILGIVFYYTDPTGVRMTTKLFDINTPIKANLAADILGNGRSASLSVLLVLKQDAWHKAVSPFVTQISYKDDPMEKARRLGFPPGLLAIAEQECESLKEKSQEQDSEIAQLKAELSKLKSIIASAEIDITEVARISPESLAPFLNDYVRNENSRLEAEVAELKSVVESIELEAEELGKFDLACLARHAPAAYSRENSILKAMCDVRQKRIQELEEKLQKQEASARESKERADKAVTAHNEAVKDLIKTSATLTDKKEEFDKLENRFFRRGEYCDRLKARIEELKDNTNRCVRAVVRTSYTMGFTPDQGDLEPKEQKEAEQSPVHSGDVPADVHMTG